MEATAPERETCERCQQTRVLRQGPTSRLCSKCLKVLYPHFKTPTDKQLAFLAIFGLNPPLGISRAEVTQLIEEFKDVRYYVWDVWEAITGKRPKDCGLPIGAMDGIARRVLADPQLRQRIVAMAEWEFETACDRAESARLLLKRGEEERPFKEFVPPLKRDATFAAVERVIRDEMDTYLPPATVRGWLGRLLWG